MTTKAEKCKAEQWRERIERFAVSGQQVKVFCQAEGVSEAVFYRWRQRLRYGAPRAGGFIAVPAAPTEGQARPRGRPWELRLDLGDGLVLHLARH